MKALITGGGGFLGRYIVNQLVKRNDSVRIFSRTDHSDLRETRVEIHTGDITDAEAVNRACKDVDTVFHLAAKVGHWGKRELFYQTNFYGTQNVLDACLKNGVKSLVYTSSPSVVFDFKEQCLIDETYPYPKKYKSYYAESKASAEKLVLSSNKLSGLRTLSLRPHLIWGPGDPHFIPSVIDKARKGQLKIIGNRYPKTDLTYVENAATAHILASNKLHESDMVSGKAYFIGQDDPTDLWGFINSILKRLDIPPVTAGIPEKLAYSFAATTELIHTLLPGLGQPRVTRFLVGQMTHSHYFDLTRAKKELGYYPKLSTAEGLDILIKELQSF